jgi:hypothetical protein
MLCLVFLVKAVKLSCSPGTNRRILHQVIVLVVTWKHTYITVPVSVFFSDSWSLPAMIGGHPCFGCCESLLCFLMDVFVRFQCKFWCTIVSEKRNTKTSWRLYHLNSLQSIIPTYRPCELYCVLSDTSTIECRILKIYLVIEFRHATILRRCCCLITWWSCEIACVFSFPFHSDIERRFRVLTSIQEVPRSNLGPEVGYIWSVALQLRPGLGLPYGFHDSFIARCGVISSTIDLF